MDCLVQSCNVSKIHQEMPKASYFPKPFFTRSPSIKLKLSVAILRTDLDHTLYLFQICGMIPALVDYFEFAFVIDDRNIIFKRCQRTMRSVSEYAQYLCFFEI